MADITTQSLSQPKKEVKRNPVIGLMEDSFETLDFIMGGPQSKFVNEGPVSGVDLEQLSQMPEHKPGLPPSGSIRFNSKEGRDNPQTAQEIQIGKITRDILQIHREQSIRPSVDQRREELNILLKLNPSYMETMDNQGHSREYYQSEADRKLNSQMREEELKAQREAMRTQALGKSKSFMGENELLLGGENKSHWTQGVG